MPPKLKKAVAKTTQNAKIFRTAKTSLFFCDSWTTDFLEKLLFQKLRIPFFIRIISIHSHIGIATFTAATT